MTTPSLYYYEKPQVQLRLLYAVDRYDRGILATVFGRMGKVIREIDLAHERDVDLKSKNDAISLDERSEIRNYLATKEEMLTLYISVVKPFLNQLLASDPTSKGIGQALLRRYTHPGVSKFLRSSVLLELEPPTLPDEPQVSAGATPQVSLQELADALQHALEENHKRRVRAGLDRL